MQTREICFVRFQSLTSFYKSQWYIRYVLFFIIKSIKTKIRGTDMYKF